MATTSSRVLTLLGALLVGGLLVWMLKSPPVRPHPPFDADGTNAILVGPKAADVSIPRAYLSKKANDMVVWVAKDPKAGLYIDFEKEVFEDMTPTGGRYRVVCEKSRCDSHAIKAEPGEYVYYQTLVDSSGTPVKEDGWIVINP